MADVVPDPSSARLILASTSMYRRDLLARLRLPFSVCAPRVDESAAAGEAPGALARRLALAKADAVAARYPHALVIGSDQTATLDGRAIIGKPGDFERAREQLRASAGRTLHFVTALALRRAADGFERLDDVVTEVRMRALDEATIDAYLHAEQPFDCAGAAKSEGLGIAVIERIDGPDPTALIGLPLIRLCELLEEAGLPVLGTAAAGGPLR